MIIPVILSGGSGTRLWPLSTREKPKQFLSLFSDQSLFQETILRCETGKETAEPIIVGNERHRFLTLEQMEKIGVSPAAILLEPVGRNTAPAIAAAAFQALKENDDALLFVMPSDHLIADREAFSQAVHAAKEQALSGKLVTFGIVPTHPETGYGYIKSGQTINDLSFKVDQFVEKPNLENAQNYLDQGGYYWNSGMFMFSAKRYLEEMEKFVPTMFNAAQKAFEKAKVEEHFVWLDPEIFAECPADSIDYAIMEKTADAVVVPMDAGWSDIGSWKSIADLSPKDQDGNTLMGNVKVKNVKNSYVRAETQELKAAGLSNVVFIEANGKVVVLDKESSQEIKSLI